MRIDILLLVTMASNVVAFSVFDKRQNDVQECVNGQGDKLHATWDGQSLDSSMGSRCWLTDIEGQQAQPHSASRSVFEGPDEANAGVTCKGYCRVVGHPAPISECYGGYAHNIDDEYRTKRFLQGKPLIS